MNKRREWTLVMSGGNYHLSHDVDPALIDDCVDRVHVREVLPGDDDLDVNYAEAECALNILETRHAALVEAARPFLDGKVVDETSGTIPLIEALRKALEKENEDDR